MAFKFGGAMVCVLLLSCAASADLKIGFLGTLTGSSSEASITARRTLEMIVSQENAHGGLNGHRIELFVLDDKNTPEGALEAFRSFKRLGVHAVVGPFFSGMLIPNLPYITEQKILTISPTVSSIYASGKDDYFFRVISGNDRIGDLIGSFVLDSKFRSLAVVVETSNEAYTRPILDRIKLAIEGSPVRIDVEYAYDLRKKVDTMQIAQTLSRTNPEAYVVLSNAYESALIGQQLAKLGKNEPVVLTPWAMTREIVQMSGRQSSRFVIASYFDVESQSEPYLDFKNKYKQVFNEDPDFFSIFTADAFSILKQVFESTDDWSVDAAKKKILEIRKFKTLQDEIAFDANGDVRRPLYLYAMRDGDFVRAKP